MKRRPEVLPWIIPLLFGMQLSCHLYKLEQRLDPANADFLSKASHIITKQERKIFLELPEADRAAFIDEFWKRRDPTPGTEANEFRDQYEKRVAETARLFQHESKPGWLTDRGRIYILFGPPTDRLTYPLGDGSPNSCKEIWYYGNFPVLFADRVCNGEFHLETYDLSSLRDFNLMYMHELNRAQDYAQKVIRPEGSLFDFSVRLRIATRTSTLLTGRVIMQIPYEQLSFSTADGRHRCTLDIVLAFSDAGHKIICEFKTNSEILLADQDLNSGEKRRIHSLEVPFAISDAASLARLVPGNSFLEVTLTNRTDNRSLQKEVGL